ncbi:hypothetical protein M758_12G126300 [Ceratodon purpureus]|nr:hypothetical protein M758_12G126300 [Ceratodon purpureus]
MDSEKGALLAWMGLVFMRRGAVGGQVPKPWLPDLPHLGRFLENSDNYVLTEQCNREIRMLGSAANFTFAEYLANYHTPVQAIGSSAANPIVVDDYTDATSVLDSSPLSLCWTKGSSWCLEVVSQGTKVDEDGVTSCGSAPSCSVCATAISSPCVVEALDELTLDDLVLADMAEELLGSNAPEPEVNGAVAGTGNTEDLASNLLIMLANVTIQNSTMIDGVERSKDGKCCDTHMYSPPRRE